MIHPTRTLCTCRRVWPTEREVLHLKIVEHFRHSALGLEGMNGHGEGQSQGQIHHQSQGMERSERSDPKSREGTIFSRMKAPTVRSSTKRGAWYQ